MMSIRYGEILFEGLEPNHAVPEHLQCRFMDSPPETRWCRPFESVGRQTAGIDLD